MDLTIAIQESPGRTDDTLSPGNGTPLGSDELRRINAYWRAANYLSVGQIYLYDNPLLREPLTLAHVKPLVVGHWGTTPGQNFIYVHLNRVIKKYDLDMFYVAGPGHGGPAIVGNVYLEGTWSEVYPNVTQDEAGLKKLFTQFSFPGGISSHVAPTTPGSIHEGGELGYSLSHAFGAAFDNPDLIVACVVGDGEAETGPLATAWQSNKFLNRDHRRGRAADPAPEWLQDQQPDRPVPDRASRNWSSFSEAAAGRPTSSKVTIRKRCISSWPRPWTRPSRTSGRSSSNARSGNDTARPRWPMIVLRSPKGWTGPKVVDGLQVEGTFRAHQVPLLVDADHPEHVAQLEAWMKSYKAEELFDESGRLIPELAELAPKGDRRMGANPHANGGLLLHDLRMPDFHQHAVTVPSPGAVDAQDTMVLGKFLRDIAKLNEAQRNFRIFGPDETLSNLLGAVFEVTNRQWDAREVQNDEFLAPAGQVLDSMLSEHQCEGWLEGYLLTGRHGLFNSYEAFIRIVDSMFSQHAKWLKVTRELPWRRPDLVAELSARLACLAAGSQRLHASGSWVPRPRDQQEGRHRARVSAARRQLSSVGLRSLPAQPELRQRGRGRQTRAAAMAEHGRRRHPLHGRARHLAMGQQRPGQRAGRRHGLLRRHADAGDSGGGFHPSRASARAENPRDQRRRSDAAAIRERASARPERHRITTRFSPKTSTSSSASMDIRGWSTG